MAWLIATRSGKLDQDVRLRGGQTTIGRGDCDLRLREQAVSRIHCRVVADGNQFVIIDQSSGGTWLNGTRMTRERPYRLTPDDRVTVGPYEIRLVLELEEEDGDVDTRKPEELPLLIGQSPAIQRLQDQIFRAAQQRMPVLIRGETGTGKSHVARLIHGLSTRRSFVVVNAATLSGELVESALYGHERGAFTGATERRDGYFQRAHRGTLFLDEIGDLPVGQQSKLLLALDHGEVRRVGGTEPERVDVRTIAATHRDLEAAIAEGTFRQDLYYRLCGVELTIPPLRERPDDVPELAQAYLDTEHSGVEITERALARLSKEPWPGNVRELHHALDRAAVAAGDAQRVDVAQLDGKPAPRSPPTRAKVIAAMRRTTGQRPAARILGIHRSRLRRLMEAYGISPETGGD